MARNDVSVIIGGAAGDGSGSANTIFTRTWADTVAAIQKVHRREASVALYPYAAIQHPPGELDG